MKKLIPTLISGAALLVMAGCTDQYGYYRPGATVGTVGGAVAGGVIGSQVAGNTGVGIIGGTLLGGFLGNIIGSSFDQPTVYAVDQSGNYAFAYGRPRTWRTTTCYGEVIPRKVYYTSARQMCRPFKAKVYMHNGMHKIVHGTACRNASGQWVIVR